MDRKIDPQKAIECLAAIIKAWEKPSYGDPSRVVERLCDPIADAQVLLGTRTETGG